MRPKGKVMERETSGYCGAGLLPVAGSNPLLLILGSFPSEVSIREGQYYANRRNSFWRIMEELFGIDSELSYEERTAALTATGIALWDVISSCSRDKSADASIRDARPNDIPGFLWQNPTIRCIVLNGSSGAGLWFKRSFPVIKEDPAIEVIALPSTSPANAAYTFERKVAAWKRIVPFVLGP